MTVSVSETIKASREQVWHLVTDADSWVDMISGILAVEVLERPASGIVGLKWKETRTMFGKEADETMWITAAEPYNWYETRAENHGAIYNTRVSLDSTDDTTTLTMQFSAKGTTFFSKLMSSISFLFSGTIRKMLQQDLRDIRDAAERS